ncbi:MAG: hypothetical protein ABFD57_02555, partial [Smithella sp.]
LRGRHEIACFATFYEYINDGFVKSRKNKSPANLFFIIRFSVVFANNFLPEFTILTNCYNILDFIDKS